jgi:hypothetical protein
VQSPPLPALGSVDAAHAGVSAEELKTIGNRLYSQRLFLKSIAYYTAAIAADASNPLLFSNRSALLIASILLIPRFQSTLSVSRDSPLTSYNAEQVDMKHPPTNSLPNRETLKPRAQHSSPVSLIVSFSCHIGDARHFLNSIWHRQRSGLNYQMRVILNDIHPMAMARLVVFFLQVSPL